MISDGFGGQKKNMLSTSMNLESIDHKFFETGHTEMNCDSIHSKIEKKSKNVPGYMSDGWA